MRQKITSYISYITYLTVFLTLGVIQAAPAAQIRGSLPAKIRRIAQQLVQRLDRNSDQKIDAAEWAALASASALPDGDADGGADLQEVADWLTRYGRGQRLWLGPVGPATRPTAAPEPPTAPFSAADSAADKTSVPATGNPASRPRGQRFFVPAEALPAGLPEWFVARDADGDGQLTLSEYSPRGVPAEVRDFSIWDADGDGVVTASEYLSRGASRTP